MNLKAIFTTILVVCSITLLNAQSKDILAKSAMLNADEAYANGQYSECLDYLYDVVTNLEKTNSRIQYLRVKSLMAMGTNDQYNKTIWLQADTALKLFFEVTPENGYVPEKYEEMIMALGKVKKNITAAETGSVLNIEMILIQGGTYQMGSNEGESDEQPVHSVSLRDFYIGKTEVTQKLWSYIMGNNPSGFQNCDNCPVEQVSWNDVQNFIEKLNQKTGKKYRLPAEAEWEYSARGGNMSKGYLYSGSDNLDEVAWYEVNSGLKTHEVGQKKPNELGIYDMSGNVSEWCSDEYRDAYTPDAKKMNIFCPVIRGGTWKHGPEYCRTTCRGRNGPTVIYDVRGFRLVLVP